MKRFLLCLIAVLCVAAGVAGCAISRKVTPAVVDPRAVDYAAEAGVIDPNDYGGYANLEKAVKLEAAVANAYELNDFTLHQALDKNTVDARQLGQITSRNTKIALAREGLLFGEKGLLTLGLGMIGMGSLGGFVGLLKKRKGDFTPAELEGAMAQAGIEVGVKERQFCQLVKGAQLFFDQHQVDDGQGGVTDDAAGKELKAAMGHIMDTDTRMAVKVAKT